MKGDHDPPVFDDPEDGVRPDPEEVKRLQAQAHEMGLHIRSTDPVELEALLALARQERGFSHPVPCYGLSYDPTDRRCRICQLRAKCAQLDTRPRVEVGDVSQLPPVPCEVCNGVLDQDLEHPETGQLRDYGCTTPGCDNTLGAQCGWEYHGGDVARQIVLPKDDQAPADQDASDSRPPSKEETHPRSSDAPDSPEPSLPERPKPKIRLVKPTKKAGRKPADKSKSPPKAVKAPKVAKTPKAPKKVSKVPKVSKAPKPRTGTKRPVFVYDGRRFKSLSAVAAAVSGTKNWSGKRFFQIEGPVQPGQALKREWRGEMHVVHVVEPE